MANKLKYSKAIAILICDKVEQGVTLRGMCEHYKDSDEFPLPNEHTIYQWKKRYPEFKAMLDMAYQTFFYKKIDELEELSTAKLDSDPDDKIAINAEINLRRLRIDTLKFILAKLAPKLCKDLADVATNQVSIQLPTINIIKYEQEVPALEHKP